MTIAEAVIEKLRDLPPDKQQEVLDFVEFLAVPRKADQSDSKPRRRNPLGLFADLKISLSEEDIAEVRREMWKNFPREID
jgi:Protein of unknown function (DUF2281)